MAKRNKTLKEWLKAAEGAPLTKELNRELNEFLSTQGVEYPQGVLSAYMIKKEILKGNLKAIRLEAKVKGEYLGDAEEDSDTDALEEIFFPEYSEKPKETTDEAAQEIAAIEKKINKIKAALGVIPAGQIESKSLKEWLLFLDSYKAPEALQEDMNRVFNTQGEEYPIGALSTYILRKEILKGNLNAIRLESIIRGTIEGEKQEIGLLDTIEKEDELREWERAYQHQLRKEGTPLAQARLSLKELLGEDTEEDSSEDEY